MTYNDLEEIAKLEKSLRQEWDEYTDNPYYSSADCAPWWLDKIATIRKEAYKDGYNKRIQHADDMKKCAEVVEIAEQKKQLIRTQAVAETVDKLSRYLEHDTTCTFSQWESFEMDTPKPSCDCGLDNILSTTSLLIPNQPYHG